MEKKAPERKVRLREGDVFYVYDKRINKCIREGCEGIVKYGLTLKVNMPNGDTLNTYECNKCHMKYTAYPNYVRLTETKGLSIYNRDEVDVRDQKRAADAAKQASRERKKAFARRYASQAHKSAKKTEKKGHCSTPKEDRPCRDSKYGNKYAKTGQYNRQNNSNNQ
ncbi:MAG: hypothetical protein K2N44_15535 [Lachnospiraceae bacterium]|nr:hypothetical protein [Lachnospiraceae bacterium]